MANLQNFRHPSHVGLLENVGQKVKHAAEFAGTMKGIYDVGKMVYSGFFLLKNVNFFKAFVGQVNASQYHVFELTRQLPRFSMYSLVPR